MSRLLAAIYGVSVLLVAILVGFVLGTIGALPFVVVPRGRRERYTIEVAVCFARVVTRWLLLVDSAVSGAPELASNEGAVVLLCNHRSWLDPLLLMAHTRSNGLSKGLIAFIPFVGLYGWLAGAVFFDRRRPRDRQRARREVLHLVRSGHRVQVFPEGTRSRDGELGARVYLNLPRDCFHERLPVVCCAVWGTERVLPPGQFAAWPRQAVRLSIGRTLRPAEHADAGAFADACWSEVRRLVEALREEEGARSGDRTRNPEEGRGF